MASNTRFGRRVALPSTASIKHEMRLLMSLDRIEALKAELSALPTANNSSGTTDNVSPTTLRGD